MLHFSITNRGILWGGQSLLNLSYTYKHKLHITQTLQYLFIFSKHYIEEAPNNVILMLIFGKRKRHCDLALYTMPHKLTISYL